MRVPPADMSALGKAGRKRSACVEMDCLDCGERHVRHHSRLPLPRGRGHGCELQPLFAWKFGDVLCLRDGGTGLLTDGLRSLGPCLVDVRRDLGFNPGYTVESAVPAGHYVIYARVKPDILGAKTTRWQSTSSRSGGCIVSQQTPGIVRTCSLLLCACAGWSLTWRCGRFFSMRA